jgi:hypothetical protein
MRDLTNVFPAIPVESTSTHGIKVEDDEHGSRHLLEYREKVSEVNENLASIPSTYAPGHITSQDWVYEACLTAALIYTVAINDRVPFSVAVRSR